MLRAPTPDLRTSLLCCLCAVGGDGPYILCTYLDAFLSCYAHVILSCCTLNFQERCEPICGSGLSNERCARFSKNGEQLLVACHGDSGGKGRGDETGGPPP